MGYGSSEGWGVGGDDHNKARYYSGDVLRLGETADQMLGIGGEGGKKGGAPKPPDYIGAAREQGRQNILLAQTNARLNNPNVNTPLGSRTVQYGNPAAPESSIQDEYNRRVSTVDADHQSRYGKSLFDPSVNEADRQSQLDQLMRGVRSELNAGDPNVATVTETLSPQAQRMFDTQMNSAEQGLNRAAENFSQPFAFGGMNDLQDKAEQAILSRMEPKFQRDEDSLRTKLALQGLDPFGEAANREFERLGQTRNDARSQAILQAFGLRPQMLQEEMAIRSMPLNEASAIMGGKPVQMPQFQGYSPVGIPNNNSYMDATKAAGDYATDIYNMNTMRQAGLMNGLFSLGGAAMSFFSDRRLKSNVLKVGEDPRGFGIYEYEIFGRRERGVMADEVREVIPDAVSEHDSGYLMVDYGRLQWH